jgi:hypothetical protein
MNDETQQTAVEQIINKIDEMQKRYIDYGKQNKSLKKQVDAVLTATTLLKMDCIDIKEIEHNQMMQCYSDGLGNGMAVGQGECSYESVADEKEYLIKKYGGNK